MSQVFTHTGVIRNRYGNRKVDLRETNCYWISAGNLRYSKKKNGLSTSVDTWNIERLDLSTIKVKVQPHD